MPNVRTRRSLWSCLGALFLLCATFQSSAFGDDLGSAERPLYSRLGGLAPISVVVSDFIDAVVPDPFMNQNPAIAAARERVPSAYLKFQVTALVCQTTGGPCQYTGRSMKAAHAHLNITEQEWDRMVAIFKEVLAKNKVPAREQQELVEIVESTKADIVLSEGAEE